MKVNALLNAAAEKLQASGIETPRLDAEVLLSHVMEMDRFRMLADHDAPVPENRARDYDRLIERRMKNEPVAYLTGTREFYSIEFYVNRDVLIPRPETELLVDFAVYYARLDGSVLDVGTGSGAIAVSLKRNRPDLSVWAVDISEKALAVAEKNADEILGDQSVTFLRGDLFEPVNGMKYNVIVSNPPYVGPGMKQELPPSLMYEPEEALFCGDSGREVISRIVAGAENYLTDPGYLILEIGDTMKEFAVTTGSDYGYTASVFSDYAGRPRVAVLKIE